MGNTGSVSSGHKIGVFILRPVLCTLSGFLSEATGSVMQAKENLKIAAVIVTYRNFAMLCSLLEDLLLQSTALDEIIVIDNSADDRAVETPQSAFPGVVYRKMPENAGSAGGYSEGIRMAAATADYVLTLDDDVRMPPDAVANLLAGMRQRERQGLRVGAVRAVGPNHSSRIPEELKDVAWRGTLFSRSAIEKAGLPLREYFLYGDDLEYSLRMAKEGFRFFWVPSSVVEEMRKGDRVTHRFFGKRFVLYRDDFRLYYALRNQIHAYRVHRHCANLLRTLLYGAKMMIFFVLHKRGGERVSVLTIWNGITDGFRSRLGKNGNYLPAGEIPCADSNQLRAKAV